MGKWGEEQKKWALFILFLVGLFLIFRYILPLFWPFIIAFIIVAPLDKCMEKISKKMHIGKGILAGIIVTFILVVILAIVCLAGSYILRLVGSFVEYSDVLEQELNRFTLQICKLMEQQFGVEATHVESWMSQQIDQILSGLQNELVPKMMNQSVSYLMTIGEALIFIVISWIAAVLLAKDFNRIRRQFQNNCYIRYAKNELKKLGHFIRTFILAQIIIMTSVSAICTAGFLFSGFRFKSSIGLGILTGMLDVLPFLGTGVVLLPIAIWQLVMGDIGIAITLFVTFLITVAVRETLEPRLIGEKMGLWPIAILMSVYVGVQVFGILGVILGPIYLIIAADWYFNAEITT